MPNPNPGLMQTIRPFSLQHARALPGGTSPLAISMLVPLLKSSYGWFDDEFIQGLDTTRWTTAVTAGGGPTPFAYNAIRGGVIQGATGTTDNDATAISLAQTFLDPDDNPFMLIQWRANAVTGFSFEIGFSDPKTDEALPGVTDVDTPTVGNGVTDMLAVHMDTDQTLTAAALVGDGTTGAAVKQDLYLGGPGGSTRYTPTAAAWQTYLIGVRDNLGYVSIWDGDGFVGHFSASNGPDGGVLVRPYALFRTRNTVTKTIDIRKICVGWEQNG
mgnify:CR=1 FL=1